MASGLWLSDTQFSNFSDRNHYLSIPVARSLIAWNGNRDVRAQRRWAQIDGGRQHVDSTFDDGAIASDDATSDYAIDGYSMCLCLARDATWALGALRRTANLARAFLFIRQRVAPSETRVFRYTSPVDCAAER
jgi:hypothetical protein